MITQPTGEIKPLIRTTTPIHQVTLNNHTLQPLLTECEAIWWVKRLAKLPGVRSASYSEAEVV